MREDVDESFERPREKERERDRDRERKRRRSKSRDKDRDRKRDRREKRERDRGERLEYIKTDDGGEIKVKEEPIDGKFSFHNCHQCQIYSRHRILTLIVM